jgi:DNA polymerase-3 subunit chi
MPKVNFYLLKQTNLQARTALACKLTEQLHKQGLSVQVLTVTEEAARELDALLWQYPAEGFMPHALATENAGTGITLCWTGRSGTGDNLLNLTDEIPDSHGRVDSIAEFVINDDDAKARSREKWNHYKNLGYELQHHQL